MFREQEIINKLDSITRDLTQVKASLDTFIEIMTKTRENANTRVTDAYLNKGTCAPDEKTDEKPKKPTYRTPQKDISPDVKGETEEWRRVVIPDDRFKETFAEVSNLGRVRDSRNKRIMRQTTNDSGKPRVSISYFDGVRIRTTNMLVENLVGRAFIDKELPVRTKAVYHADDDVYNNRADNLYIKSYARIAEKRFIYE